MEIDKLINILKNRGYSFITRGTVIDMVSDNSDEWIMVLKALLIKNPKRSISISYLLEKLDFMKRHPEAPYTFLDYQGAYIFSRLKQD